MRDYLLTQRVVAKPMTRAEYKQYRGWELLGNENGNESGYMVDYFSDANLCWMPANIFERDANPLTGHDSLRFDMAIIALKQGISVTRAAWNDMGRRLTLMTLSVQHLFAESAAHESGHWIGVMNADKHFEPWIPTQADMLADDWMIV